MIYVRVSSAVSEYSMIHFKTQQENTHRRLQVLIRLDRPDAPPIELVQLSAESRKAMLEVVSTHTCVRTEEALASQGGLPWAGIMQLVNA